MAKLTYAQLRNVWLTNAKGTKYGTAEWANLMAAIGLAESSGITNRVNPNDNNGKQSSFGIWQISTGTHTPPSPNWADPNVNAKLAIGKLQSQGLQAWGTFDNGAYKAYLSGAVPHVGAGPGGGKGAVVSAAGKAAGAVAAVAGTNADCLVAWPKFSLGPVSAGGSCIFSKSQARAVVGGLMLAPAVGFTLVGAVVLAAFAFRRTGAGRAVGGAAEATGAAVAFIPGGEAAGAAIAASGSQVKRAARRDMQARDQAKQQRQAKAREDREGREYDEVMARNRDSAKGPAPRDREREPVPF